MGGKKKSIQILANSNVTITKGKLSREKLAGKQQLYDSKNRFLIPNGPLMVSEFLVVSVGFSVVSVDFPVVSVEFSVGSIIALLGDARQSMTMHQLDCIPDTEAYSVDPYSTDDGHLKQLFMYLSIY
ncbi:hypothetical protein G9A89_000146 [Geosiphon pyriformis]|nr:hypothetical protein G9A89_000146 [Geosiphon pyriformis]